MEHSPTPTDNGQHRLHRRDPTSNASTALAGTTLAGSRVASSYHVTLARDAKKTQFRRSNSSDTQPTFSHRRGTKANWHQHRKPPSQPRSPHDETWQVPTAKPIKQSTTPTPPNGSQVRDSRPPSCSPPASIRQQPASQPAGGRRPTQPRRCFI